MAVTNPTGTGTEAGTRSEATAAEACSRGSSAKQEWEENIGRGDASSLPSNGRVGVCWFRRERKLAAMVSMTGKACGHDGVSPGLGFCSSSELDGRTDMGMAFGGFLQGGKSKCRILDPNNLGLMAFVYYHRLANCLSILIRLQHIAHILGSAILVHPHQPGSPSNHCVSVSVNRQVSSFWPPSEATTSNV